MISRDECWIRCGLCEREGPFLRSATPDKCPWCGGEWGLRKSLTNTEEGMREFFNPPARCSSCGTPWAETVTGRTPQPGSTDAG